MESVLNSIVPPVPIQFSKRITFRTGADGIDINAAADPRLVAALLGNAPFPEGLEVPLSGVQIAASGGQDILFDGGKGTVKFAASVDSLASLGIYLDPAHLTKDSGTDQYFGDSLVLPALSSGYYLLLKWGYDASASGQGSVALGPATVQFGAEGKSGRRFSIIRKVTGNPAAPKALVDLLDSWTIPPLIAKPTDLQLDTWLFAETDGRLQGSLGVSYGYDFNWVREASLGGLSGDIGLKVQLGLDAALSVDISSSFAVVVNREADQVLRVRVFKQPKKGWQFALNAGATVNAVTPELPQNLDDFVLSILDLQNQQLLMDLKDLKSWVSGQAPLSGALAGIVPRYMEQLLQTVYTATTGKPFDFEQAKTRVLQFLDTWGGLDSKIASIIWNNIPDKTLVGQMADICRQITSCNAPADYAAFIDKVASQPAFLSSPSGQWLESLALGAILRPLESDATFAAIKNAAATASPFLADASSERALLEALHGWIDPRIGLSAIRKVANGIDLTQLDAWVKAKLQRFLDETVLSLTGVQKVQSMIQLLQSKAGSFYEHARKALSDTYTLSLSALYQTSSTSTAMFDVTFDFGDIKARPAQLQALVGEVIAGNFRNVLGTSEAGVRINRSILTHGLSRHQHIELRMPFYHSTFDEINQSLAKVDSVGSDSGRMLVYQLDAKDDIGAITNRGASYSHLGLAATIVAPNNARKHSSPNFSYNYVYRAASDDMRRAQLQYQIGAYVDAYLGGAFQTGEASFDTWLSDLDRAVSRAETDHYGHTLLELDVDLKADAVAAWLNAPSDEKSQAYMNMSLALQRSGLKKLIPFYYFSDIRRYQDLGAAYPLILFSCIPAAVSVNPETLQMTFRDVYWDYRDPELRHKMIMRTDTREIVRTALGNISKRLAASGMGGEAKRYAPEDGIIDQIRRSALDDIRLLGLLQSEAQMLEGARAAGLAMAKFRSRLNDPQNAVRAFAAWGADVTRTFNGVGSLYGGEALRALGTMMFVVASASLGGPSSSTTALLRIGVLKSDTKFDNSQFLQGVWPDSGDLAVQQSIVNA